MHSFCAARYQLTNGPLLAVARRFGDHLSRPYRDLLS